ncbi:hypothetical protein M2153_003203 [Pseudomonas sp. JUb96]|nr:hypothetical protein [Pseudomonas sp. JUb96]
MRIEVGTRAEHPVQVGCDPLIELGRGSISKMSARLDAPVVQYAFRLGEQEVPVNPLIGKTLRLEYLGAIHCTHCGRKTKTSFSQGYCYPCMTKLAQCDVCIMAPEKCHYDQGTCREPGWGEQFCMTDHVVYLANSSGIKVGITRASQLPTRWLDQGASQALPIVRVATRQQSGLVEDLFRSQVADRTNWRALLKGDAEAVDLLAVRAQLFASCAEGLSALQGRFGLQAIQPLNDGEVLEIRYPVEAYPSKIVSFNLDKNPVAEGTLLGIKGQYLIFDTGVINIRKYTAYQLAVHQ